MFSEAASIFGREVDTAFFFILGVCVFMLVLVTGVMVFFVIRYRRKNHPVAVQIPGNVILEIIWTVVPTLLVLAMFYYGWIGYRKLQVVPADALKVKVTARMWSWAFEYGNGKQGDLLDLPLGGPVRLDLSSEDVLHSFYLPAFRIKKDVVPGMQTTLWFTPDEPGTYDLFCAEYCGVGHSAMLSKVVVLPEQEFEAWLQGGKEETEGAPKADLPKVKGCTGCHSLDGSRLVGPTLNLRCYIKERRHTLIWK